MANVHTPLASSPQVITDMNVQLSKPLELLSNFRGAKSCTEDPR